MKFYLVAFLCLSAISVDAQRISEATYANLINQTLRGEREHKVTSGRVDILTNEYAIEVERADKWKQSIGQALWYGLQTSRQPGIVLILEEPADYKYYIQLNTALDYGGLDDHIRVWRYPDDFPDAPTTYESPVEAVPGYWLTVSSGVRHNSGCSYYRSTRGKACAADAGRACKRCGG